MVIARNELTVKFNRRNRFLIDDPESGIKLSYQLTKPLKLGGTFNNEGIFKFVLQEVSSTDDDNQKLGIADYYKFFPKDTDESGQKSDDDSEEDEEDNSEENVESERRSWL